MVLKNLSWMELVSDDWLFVLWVPQGLRKIQNSNESKAVKVVFFQLPSSITPREPTKGILCHRKVHRSFVSSQFIVFQVNLQLSNHGANL